MEPREPRREARAPPGPARRLPLQGRQGAGDLRRQGGVAPEPRALLLPGVARARSEDRRAGRPHRRPRVHRHRQRARGADPRVEPGQAQAPAPLQHHPAGRQALPVPQAHHRTRSSRACWWPGGCRRTARPTSGPFYPATAMRETLRLVRQLFPLRTCSHQDRRAGSSARASSTTSTGATPRAPGGRRARATRGRCRTWRRFLEGKDDDLARRLTAEMEEAAARGEVRAGRRPPRPDPGAEHGPRAPEDHLRRGGGPGHPRAGPPGLRGVRPALLRAHGAAARPGGVLLRQARRRERRRDPLGASCASSTRRAWCRPARCCSRVDVPEEALLGEWLAQLRERPRRAPRAPARARSASSWRWPRRTRPSRSRPTSSRAVEPAAGRAGGAAARARAARRRRTGSRASTSRTSRAGSGRLHGRVGGRRHEEGRLQALQDPHRARRGRLRHRCAEVLRRRYGKALEERRHAPRPDPARRRPRPAERRAHASLEELGLDYLPIVALAKRAEEVYHPGQPPAARPRSRVARRSRRCSGSGTRRTASPSPTTRSCARRGRSSPCSTRSRAWARRSGRACSRRSARRGGCGPPRSRSSPRCRRSPRSWPSASTTSSIRGRGGRGGDRRPRRARARRSRPALHRRVISAKYAWTLIGGGSLDL